MMNSNQMSPEQILANLGIASTVVDECGDRECRWCQPEDMPLAA